MNLLRRLLGNATDNSGRTRSSRRAAHVTPSNDQRPAYQIPDADLTPEGAEDLAPQTEVASAPSASSQPQQRSRESSPTLKPVPDSAKALQRQPRGPVTEAVAARPSRRTGPYQTLTYGIASDVGMLRDNNEDASFAMHWHSIMVEERPDFGFFVVADGMGGHLDGEKAAGLAVQTLSAEMLEKIYVPLLRDFHSTDSPTILDALVTATEKANLAVIKRVPGGGTTLSSVAIVGNLAYLVHVGDSRVYQVHDGQIEQLTTDHTLVQRLIEMKELTPEEAEYYPQKNVLYRAIGQNEQLKMQRLIRNLPPAAQILICSDGLWELVEDDMIKQVTLEAETPQLACNRLIALANERGGIDNITVVIIKTPGDTAPT